MRIIVCNMQLCDDYERTSDVIVVSLMRPQRL